MATQETTQLKIILALIIGTTEVSLVYRINTLTGKTWVLIIPADVWDQIYEEPQKITPETTPKP